MAFVATIDFLAEMCYYCSSSYHHCSLGVQTEVSKRFRAVLVLFLVPGG